MPDVTLLWYKPDRPAVRPLIERLESLGLEVWRDEDHAEAGDHMPDVVDAVLRQSKVAVLCASNAAADRKWFTAEATTCNTLLKIDSLRYVAPVRVGPLDPGKLPPAIEHQHVLDLTDPEFRESRIERLVVRIFEELKRPLPQVVTAGVLAMNRDECQQLLEDEAVSPEIVTLCKDIGIPDDEFAENLLSRYGDASTDFVPFADGTPLVDIVQRAVSEANTMRGRCRLHLLWLDAPLHGSDDKARQDAFDRWIVNDSLLVLDSASLGVARVAKLLDHLTSVDEPGRQVVVCVPPYSRWTGSLETGMAVDAAQHEPLRRLFDIWRPDPSKKVQRRARQVGFDFSVAAGLGDWLRRVLERVTPIADPASAEQLEDPAAPSFDAITKLHGTEGSL